MMTLDYDLWMEFRKTWPPERVRNMTLAEYTNSGSKDTFTYWIESRLDKLGSIWGGPAFKFGIYSRNDKMPKENIGGRMYSENYGWMQKYGNTEDEAFTNIKAQIISVIEAIQKNDLQKIEQVDLGSSYKWKIAFHFQNSLDTPVCICIFRRRELEVASKSAPGASRSKMYHKILAEWNGKDILQYTRDLWNRYKQDIPTNPDDVITETIYSDQSEPEKSGGTTTEHTEIQYLLLRLGNDMGFDIWVAPNDRNKTFEGESFSSFPNIKSELPLQFEPQTNRIIQNIDVLWLKGNTYVAAFEIESTTSIYSGLLRMSDLITKQPNIKIPLYLVAPDDRRTKVISEINRPTFSRLNPPLYEICRYISFRKLKEEMQKIKSIIRYIKPEWIIEISESCEPEEV
ncbi:MAG TPA: hypothetical protein VHY08_09005 [Bacillota bacterium]|nr:hypothetical protein [Bacillota bacterium]